MDVTLVPGSVVDVTYHVVSSQRGLVRFEAAHVHLMSRWRLCELLLLRIGETDTRRVYHDCARIAAMFGWFKQFDDFALAAWNFSSAFKASSNATTSACCDSARFSASDKERQQAPPPRLARAFPARRRRARGA